jgi:hypothetical protein
MSLPETVRGAVDRVVEADRAWFEEHPDRRWFTRPMADAERQTAGLMGLFVGPVPFGPYVLVISMPSRNGRFKVPVTNPFATPADLGLDEALDAPDDVTFSRRLLEVARARGGRP